MLVQAEASLLPPIPHPAPASLVETAMQRAVAGDWAAARELLERALAIPRHRQVARFLLWEVCQAMRDPAAGVAHLNDAVAENPLTSRLSPQARRRVLAINAPGTFQANMPLAPLLDETGTELHTLWLADPEAVIADPLRAVGRHLPPFDCAFVAIAEDSRHRRALLAADRLVAALRVPVINNGARIAAMCREGVAERLRDLPNAVVPPQVLATRAALSDDPASWMRDHDLAFPVVVRPRHSHAGEGVARAADAAELRACLDRNATVNTFYLAPFTDYRSADGQWRKYRVIFVDGRPMPYHLAIHHDWAIWYYNAGMGEDAAKRAEEARFLRNIDLVFPPQAMAALRGVAERVGLDYFGLDCGLMPDGRLLVFEVETGMIVHDADPAELYPYKKECVPRIFRAVEAMIDGRIAASRTILRG